MFFLNSPSFPAYLKINLNFHLKTFLLLLQFCFSNYHVFISQVSWRLNTSMIVLCLLRTWTWPLIQQSTWTPLSATVPGRSDTPPPSIPPSRPSPRTTSLLGTLPRRQFFTALATTERYGVFIFCWLGHMSKEIFNIKGMSLVINTKHAFFGSFFACILLSKFFF